MRLRPNHFLIATEYYFSGCKFGIHQEAINLALPSILETYWDIVDYCLDSMATVQSLRHSCRLVALPCFTVYIWQH